MRCGLDLFQGQPEGRPRLSPEGEQLLALFNKVADERDKLYRDLSYACDAIDALEAHNAEYDFLLLQAQSELAERKNKSRKLTDLQPQKPVVDVNTDLAWIGNTWLCSSNNSALLGEAETQWKAGYPQRALNAISSIMSRNHELDFEDDMKCRLLIAAIFHCSGEYEKSLQFVDDILKDCGKHRITNYIQARELGGIARFIRGKNLTVLQDWHAAYWAFSGALYTPGYHVKAHGFQREAMENHMREEMARSQRSFRRTDSSPVPGLALSPTSSDSKDSTVHVSCFGQASSDQELPPSEPEYFLDLRRRCP